MKTVVPDAVDLYRRRTERSRHLHDRAREVMPGGDTRTSAFWAPYPLFIDRGLGCRIWDADGNEYLDFINNYTSLVLGHAHPAVLEAVAQAMPRGTAYAASIDVQVDLAVELVRRVPSLRKVRFCNSGTEATMFALRAARAFTGRDRIIKVEGGFHGTHDAVEVSIAPVADRMGPVENPAAVPDSPGVPRAVAELTAVVPFGDAGAVERVFRRYPEEVACVIVEPVPGVMGYLPPPPGYLSEVYRVAHRHGALVVFDEIQTLRLHEGGAQALYDVAPDLTAMGKIIGGGFPVGAFGGRQDIMEWFDPSRAPHIPHSGTFNGNRVSMAAGLATLRVLTQAAIDRLNALGDLLRARLRAELDGAGIRGQVPGVGSLLSVYFTDRPVTDYRSKLSASGTLQTLFHLHMLNRGIHMAPRCSLNVSVPMTEAEIDACAAAAGDALRTMRPDVAREAPYLLA